MSKLGGFTQADAVQNKTIHVHAYMHVCAMCAQTACRTASHRQDAVEKKTVDVQTYTYVYIYIYMQVCAMCADSHEPIGEALMYTHTYVYIYKCTYV